MTKNLECLSGSDCVEYATLGRPVYLLTREARDRGYCAGCMERSTLLLAAKGRENAIPIENNLEVEDDGAPVMVLVKIGDREVSGETEEEDKMRRLYVGDDQNRDPVGSTLRKLEEVGRLRSNASEKNPESKAIVIATMDEPLKKRLDGALDVILPSKNGPDPLLVVRRSLDDEDVKKSDFLYCVALQSTNTPLIGGVYSWASPFFPVGDFRFQLLHGKKDADKKIPHLRNDAVSAADMSCANLITKEEVQAIFGDKTPDQVGFELNTIVSIWCAAPVSSYTNWKKTNIIGSDTLPKEVAGSAAHYASAISAALEHFSGYGQEADPDMGNHALRYLERIFHEAERRGLSPEGMYEMFLNDGDYIDDFLYDSDFLDGLLDRLESESENYRKLIPHRKQLREDLKDTQRKILAFTNLMDRRWKERADSDLLGALKNRFGHPVGIPESVLKPYHFLPGGYLVESGWAKIEEKAGPLNTAFTARFPIDQNGRPSPDRSLWDSMNPTVHVRANGTQSEKFADMAEGLTMASEAWHTAYNKGLPRDSLYTGVQLSENINNPNGRAGESTAGFTLSLTEGKGFPRIAVNSRKGFHLYPTAAAKIVAVDRSFVDDRVAPNGVLSRSEIDLTNFRLARLSNIMCGNEYGVSEAKGKAPENFDKLSREWSESLQRKIASEGEKEGFHGARCPDDSELVRPLVGRQRGLTMRTFVDRPGTYLRRTGGCGKKIDRAGMAVHQQITAPLAPWSVFIDPVRGEPMDGNYAAFTGTGKLAVNPYITLAPSSGGVDAKDVDGKPARVYFRKWAAVPSGRRGENMPRRLRFAARSLGEEAVPSSGLIMPYQKTDAPRIDHVVNAFPHLKDDSYVTLDQPRYAKELTKAPWHKPNVFQRDHEMGEMAEVTRGIKDSRERSVAQQSLLNGRYSKNAWDTEFTARTISFIDYPMGGGIDPGIRYGFNPKTISVNWDHDSPVMPFYEAVTHRTQFRAVPAGQKPKDDDYQVGEHFLPAMRPGWTGSGIENTPMIFDGGDKVRSLERFRDSVAHHMKNELYYMDLNKDISTEKLGYDQGALLKELARRSGESEEKFYRRNAIKIFGSWNLADPRFSETITPETDSVFKHELKRWRDKSGAKPQKAKWFWQK